MTKKSPSRWTECSDGCPRLFDLRTKLLFYYARAKDGECRISREQATKMLCLSYEEEKAFVPVVNQLGNGVCSVKATSSSVKVLAGGVLERQDVRAVFQYWQERTGHKRAKLVSSRRTKIEARLREGYTVEQMKAAVDGLMGSSFHMGQNNQRKKYDGIDVVFRNGERLEQFADLASKKVRGRPSGVKFHGSSGSGAGPVVEEADDGFEL